ncbi:unnamed protein product [Cyprideis torosa]|uniref:Amino acid transporter n=1 Tax=Cyprideis torosa TaxID=163714 RepID=A0A7R8W943_9CRUS|nr:unnamed protein product [Cyprideis torosa]CAG0884480.1 unnamed protein product [Cyprideis torosa]
MTLVEYRTVLVPPKKEEEEEAPSRLDDLNIYEESTTTPAPSPKSLLLTWEIESEFFSSTNILGLVMFSFVFGVAICRMEEKGKILQDFFASLADAMMTITSWVIYISPIGVASLCAGQVLEMDDLSVIVGQLGMYFLTVLTGILIHGLITLPALYVIVTREMPFTFMLNMMEAIMTAFGTSSSSATLPVTFRCLENKNGIDQRVSRFVLPIGATINMDGTALYEAVAAIFISQMRGMTLGIGSIIAISITSTAASIGAAGIPSAGLVTLVMVLDTVGLPAEDVTLIIAVDWLLDRFRTACNVWGDSIGAAMVAHLSSKEVLDMDHEKMDRVSRPSVAPGMASAPAGIEMTSSDWDKANGGRSNEFPVESTNM